MFPSLELGETKISHLGIPVMIKLYVASFYVSMDDLWFKTLMEIGQSAGARIQKSTAKLQTYL